MIKDNYQYIIGPDTPREDFEGLTSEEMFWLVNTDFDEDKSPVSLNYDTDSQLIQAVQFYRHTVEYLMMLKDQQPLRLTQRGNLPVKFCRQLCDKGIFESEYVKRLLEQFVIKKETDNFYVHVINIVTQLAGFTRKRYGKMSLTTKASRYLGAGFETDLFLDLVTTYVTKFNWEYHDRHPGSWLIQGGLGFSIYLVQNYGVKPHAIRFYAEKYWRAFPELTSDFPDTQYRSGYENFEDCYCLRVIDRFLLRFGLINKEPEKGILIAGDSRITKTTLLDQLFIWKNKTRVK